MGIINTASIAIIVLVGLFGGWPIYSYKIKTGFSSSNDLNGGTIPGQVPNITGLPGLLDADTPTSVYSRTGFDGKEYKLVFSDEFNTDGRTFWPGDDPWWEAVDIHYSGTSDLEWYDPDAVTTKSGNLEITLSEEPSHGLNFRSGMLQSWNKLWYAKLSATVMAEDRSRGRANIVLQLHRRLHRSEYEPPWERKHYDFEPDMAHCGQDFRQQRLPGQRLSACTCEKDRSEHPGPNVGVGRGAPEIDIIEAQIAPSGTMGSASQSIQMAPMDAGYLWLNSTPHMNIWDSSITTQHGAIYQESMSVQTVTDATSYDGKGYSTFGVETTPGRDGQITVLNLAISNKFQTPQWGKLEFPGIFRVDYVRVYQTGSTRIGCDPDDHQSQFDGILGIELYP
ncbi:hypothetical protein RQP46_004454 [Phenoliferia psychrophenolica]